MPPAEPSRLYRSVYTGLGVLLLIGVWQALFMVSSSIIVASPAQTFHALLRLPETPLYRREFWVTLLRVLSAVGIGGVFGFVLGIAAGLRPGVYHFMEPVRWVAMSVPPVTILVVAMFYFGLGTRMVLIFSVLILWPIVYINTVKGMRLVDRQLAEMVCLYRFPLLLRVRRLYVPALAAPLLAAMVQILCSGVRVVILAEVFGAQEGIGAAIQSAGTNLDIPLLFAWVLVALGIVGVIELALLGPLHRRLAGWYSS